MSKSVCEHVICAFTKGGICLFKPSTSGAVYPGQPPPIEPPAELVARATELLAALDADAIRTEIKRRALFDAVEGLAAIARDEVRAGERMMDGARAAKRAEKLLDRLRVEIPKDGP